MKAWLQSKKNEAAWFGLFALFVGMLINSCMHGSDYHVFYLSGLRARTGQSLYQVTDYWFVFKYHPIFALAFTSFSYLPEKLGLTVLNIAMIGCWAWSLHQWAKWLGYQLTPPRIFLMTVVALSALSAEFSFGQINGALFAGLTLVFLLMEEKDQPILAGAIMALVMAVKINFGLILVYGALRNWRSLIGAAIASLFIHTAVILYFHQNFFNPAIYHDWISLLLQQSAEQFNNPEAQGFLHFFDSLLGDSAGKMAWATTVLVSVVVGCRLQLGRKKHPAVSAYWMSVLYLLSPLAWWYQLYYMFPAAFWLLKQKVATWEKRVCYFAVGIYALITFNLLGRHGVLSFKSMQVFFFASIALTALLLNTVRKPEVCIETTEVAA